MAVSTKAMPSWLPPIFVCFGLGILGVIASVIVISLITLYLQAKGTDLAIDNTGNATNKLYMVFATNLRGASGSSLAHLDSVADQMNQYIDSYVFKLQGLSGYFAASTNSITSNTSRRKKRQTSTNGAISCDTESVGTNQAANNGQKLVFVFYLDKQRTTMCPHGYCDEKSLALIESKIEAKFGSNSFPLTVTLSDGSVVTVTVLFCSYGTVVTTATETTTTTATTTTSTTTAAQTCSDGIKNQDESDTDCGGTCTAQDKTCAPGLVCNAASDCSSSVCTANICAEPTCSDTVQNQGETQVDCGGACLGLNTCVNGDTCTQDSDCVSNYCSGTTCMTPTSCFIAGTPILLANGSTTLPIEQVQINMQLLGANGEVNTVLAVRSQILNGRALYGFNGEQPFVTPEHPFRSPQNDSIRLVFDAQFLRVNRPDLVPDTIQQIEEGTELLRFNATSGLFDTVLVNSITRNDNASVNTSVYHFVTDSPSGVLGVVAHNFLTGNEWYDFHNYAASIYYQIGVATPIVAELQSRYTAYIAQTQLNITSRRYNGLVAVAVANYTYNALLNRFQSQYPPAPTQAYQTAWKSLAVPAASVYENTARGSGFNQVMKMNLIARAAWLINFDPSGGALTLMQQATNDTLDWWHSTTDY